MTPVASIQHGADPGESRGVRARCRPPVTGRGAEAMDQSLITVVLAPAVRRLKPVSRRTLSPNRLFANAAQQPVDSFP